MFPSNRDMHSHGTGLFRPEDFASIGENVVFETGVLVFHPENITIGSHVYVGHYSILKGYYEGRMMIGDGTWIGQQCFFHSAGNINIGANVGIGPGVKILSSFHAEAGRGIPILHSPIEFAQVLIEDDCDVGIGSIILPGVSIGKGSIIGAGAVVTRDVEPYSVMAGIPARCLRQRR